MQIGLRRCAWMPRRNAPASVKPTPEEEFEKSIDDFEKKLSWDSHNFILGAFDGDQLVGIAGLRRERGTARLKAIVAGSCSAKPKHKRVVAQCPDVDPSDVRLVE